MIALTVSAAAYEASPADWDFSTIGNTEGWTANDSVQEMFVQDGNLCIHIHGDSPAITANSIAVKASDFNVIDIRMKNETDSTTAALQWTTSADGIMDSKKTALFAIESNSSDVKEYHVQLSGNEEWSGTITSLRLVFQSSSGYIGIDEIRFDVCNRPAVEYIGSINPISADETTISVTGVIAADNDQTAVQLKLYELAPYQYEQDISDLIPVSVQSAPMNGNVFLFSIPRYDGQRDRVYSKFVVVQQFVNTQELQFVAAPRYVTDIQFAAENSFSYPIIETKKGLLVEMTDDAEELGIDHAIVNVEFSTMMYEENLNPNDTIIFQMDGTNYYFSKSYFESLDKKIKPLSDNGVIVNLVLILYPNFPDNSMTEVLHHPNAVMGTGGGGVLAFNTAEEAGVQAFKAAMEFLSRRYTRDDQLYGRALGFIVGNEVDAQWEWQNMGYTSPMKPVSNAYALEALFPDMALNEWRTIAVEYDQMLDLSEATHFYYYINSYGGSGGSGYETRLRLYSENDVWEQTVSMDADMWNRIEANIGNWSGRGHITKIEIAFRAIGSNAVWYSSRFQIDKVGYRKVS